MKHLVLILIAGVAGGSIFPLIKIAERYNIPKFGYIFWESAFVISLVLLASFLMGNKKIYDLHHILYYAFCALTNIFIPQTFLFTAASNVQANILGLIIAITPLAVYVASIIFFRMKPKKHKTVGAILGILGIVILFSSSIVESENKVKLPWLILSLVIPLDYTVNRLFATKLKPSKSNIYELTIGLWSLIILASGTLMLLTKQTYNPISEFSLGTVALIVHSFLAVALYFVFFTLAGVDAVKNSLSLYLVPLVAAAWGFMYFGEQLTPYFIIATVIVFTGLYLFNDDKFSFKSDS